MFGYVRPAFNELKIKDYGRFRACYCGLCHELGKDFSIFSRFILNYDFVFLAMLLWHDGSNPDFSLKRCAVSPIKKRCVCCSSNALSISAAMSIILTYRKLDDSIEDDDFFKVIGAKIGKIFLKKAYKKASSQCSEFDLNVKKNLSCLTELEENKEKSLDRTADTFATLLSEASVYESDENLKRITRHLLYHLGRTIYILDAIQDMEEDMEREKYNPVVARFALDKPKLSENEKETIRITLDNSRNCMISAFELLPVSYWHEVLKNLIYIGIPEVCENVLNGTFKNTKENISRDTLFIRNGDKI